MTVAVARRQRIRLRSAGPFSCAVVVITGWALVANFARIGSSAQTFDEPYYAIAAWRYVHGDDNPPPTGTFSNFDNFEHPPLAKYLFGFAQLFAGHASVVADRVVATLCTLGATALIAVWLGSVAGRWVGLGAAALIALLPMSVPNVPFRFPRYGGLDQVAELFAVASLVLAWTWFHREGRAAWWFAVATGACTGLAAACKENGWLGVVGPVLVGLALTAGDRRAVVIRSLQTLAAVAMAVGAFALTYLGLGHPVGAFRFLLRYQGNQSRIGHRVVFAGRVTDHPPGWAFLWFAQHGIGTFVSILCLVCVVAAIVRRHDRLVLWCLAALVGPLLFHTVIARVVLSYYWVMWMPAFLALVAIGVAELAKLAWSWPPTVVPVGAMVVATLCAAAFLVASLHDTYGTLTKPASSVTVSPYAADVRDHSPLVYLRLGDGVGSMIARDSSAGHHDGRYVNHPQLGADGLLIGDPDRGVRFNGSFQYVTIPAAAWMDVPDYTVVVWFSGTATGRYLVSRDDYAHAKVWDVAVDSAGHVECSTFARFGGAGQPVTSARAYNDGRAHMAACIKSGSSMQLYVDGMLVASAQFDTFARNSGTLGIDLARRGNGAGPFAGTLDEFAFYGTPQSGGEVRTLYRAGTDH